MKDEIQLLDKVIQFGFGAVMAFILIFIIWKLGQKVIAEFGRLYDVHKNDMKDMQELHREERKECYAKQERQIARFDETIRLVSNGK